MDLGQHNFLEGVLGFVSGSLFIHEGRVRYG